MDGRRNAGNDVGRFQDRDQAADAQGGPVVARTHVGFPQATRGYASIEIACGSLTEARAEVAAQIAELRQDEAQIQARAAGIPVREVGT